MRRAEISITVVIVAALGVVVLLILAGALFNQQENLTDAANTCPSQAACMTNAECSQKGGQALPGDRCGGAVQEDAGGGWVTFSFATGGSVCCVV